MIYCASGNKKFAETAVLAGFLYGAQLPHTIHFAPYFADQNWETPKRVEYMAALKKYRPYLATVLDWEWESQLTEVLEWAEEAAEFVHTVIIIPKVQGQVHRVPLSVGGKPIRLGYSVPTKYAETTCHLTEFMNRPIHLLGGSPRKQFELAGGYQKGSFYSNDPALQVLSVDGNYHQKQATKYCQYFSFERCMWARNKHWPALKERNYGEKWGDGSNTAGAPLKAFELSCKAIMQMWHSL